MQANLFSHFRSLYQDKLDQAFIIDETDKIYTYRTLDEETGRIANYLKSLGIVKGDRVAAYVEKSPEAIMFYLACIRSGIIFLPLNPAYTVDELKYFFDNAAPNLVVCSSASFDKISTICKIVGIKNIRTLDKGRIGSLFMGLMEQDSNFEDAHCEKNDIAVVLYTSGTTGLPKGAMISHHNLYFNGLALKNYWGFEQSDTLLHALPIFHVHGLFFACHCTLLSGAKMYFLDKFEEARVIQYLSSSTVFMGVPTYYTRLLASDNFTKACTQNIRLFISGSAPLLDATFNEFKNRTGHAILERYGMTETGIITSNPLEGGRLAGTVGVPLPGNLVRVVDDNHQPLPIDEVGHIQVKGENVFKGYWRLPEKTKEEFTPDGYFKTGDLGKIDSNGYLSIVGRSKDLIITGGLNVYPKEIESCLNRIDGVKETAVIGLPHHDFGEAVTAVIVSSEQPVSLNEATILNFAKQHLANYKVPKAVLFVTELPRNTMGKIQKNKLRERYKELYLAADKSSGSDQAEALRA